MEDTQVDPGTTETPESAPIDAVQVQAELTDLRGQFKDLQRKYERSRRKGDNVDSLSAQMEQVAKQVTVLHNAILKGELLDEGDKQSFVTAGTESQRAAALQRLQNHYADEIEDTLSDSGLNWDEEPKLSKAREAWERGEFIEAARLTRRVVVAASKPDAASIEAEVARKVEEALKKAGVRAVDTKESTTGGRLTLEQWRKLPAKERLSRTDELREIIRR